MERWMHQSESELGFATWGIRLTREERQRRFAIQSLLHHEGLDERRFAALFGTTPENAIPELQQLWELSLVERDLDTLRLTKSGVAFSDAIGPALYSATARAALLKFTQA